MNSVVVQAAAYTAAFASVLVLEKRDNRPEVLRAEVGCLGSGGGGENKTRGAILGDYLGKLQ